MRPRNAEDIATLLKLSPCSLHRHRQEEGAPRKALKDEARRTRAFKGWTGVALGGVAGWG